MRFTTLALFGASALAVAASPMDLPEDAVMVEEHSLDERATTIAVTGVTGNGVQTRMELREMNSKQPDMYNLYMLGLRQMMNVAQSNPLSYYQIAGTLCIIPQTSASREMTQ